MEAQSQEDSEDPEEKEEHTAAPSLADVNHVGEDGSAAVGAAHVPQWITVRMLCQAKSVLNQQIIMILIHLWSCIPLPLVQETNRGMIDGDPSSAPCGTPITKAYTTVGHFFNVGCFNVRGYKSNHNYLYSILNKLDLCAVSEHWLQFRSTLIL